MPSLTLTDKSIAKLKAPHPSGKQTFYWDTAQTGLAVLVSGTTDTKSFMAKGPLNGKAVVKALGKVSVMTLPEARQAAREMFRDLGAGVDPRKTKTASITLAEALESYLAAHDLAPRTRESYAETVRLYFDAWKNLPLRDLTREAVEIRHRAISKDVEQRRARQAELHAEIHRARAKRVKKQWPDAAAEHLARADAAAKRKVFSGKATANGAMRVLRAVYNFALDRNADLPPNPVRLRRQWNKVTPRERHLGHDHLPAFYKAVTELESAIARDYLLLVLFTGLRRREAAGLRWSDIDLSARKLSIPAERTKPGRKLDLPLTDYVHDLLVARRAIGRTEFIFHADSKSGHVEEPKFHLALVTKATGTRVSVHDLRRTYITIAESCDISPIALKALVNHGLGNDVTSGYVQLNVERLREPAQRVADKIKALCLIPQLDASQGDQHKVNKKERK